MSAQFVAASSQSIVTAASAITLALPFTVGFWAQPVASGVTYAVWSYGNTTDGWSLGFSTSGNCSISATVASVTDTGTGAATVAGGWHYFVGRFISDTNRRISNFKTTPTAGAFTSGQSTTSKTVAPTSPIHAFGRRLGTSFFDGNLAEAWIASADIQPDGAALTNDTVLQLALGGPFSVPHIAKDIVDYRSFRTALDSSQDNLSDYYTGNLGRQVWTNSNGATLGPHPPLPGWYRGPKDQIRTGII